MSKKEEAGNSRRDFLKLASVSAPAALAAATVAPQTAEAADLDPSGELMQDNAHTRAYFDSARF